MTGPKFVPIESYPERMPLDISSSISKYTRDKVVCDLGCGAGDLLEFLKVNNMCKDVVGVERDRNRYTPTRDYIIHADIFSIPLPEADVYLLWIGSRFPYNKIFEKMKSNKIIIYMDGLEANHTEFELNKGIHLIESTSYSYDESVYSKIPVRRPWTTKGERIVKIYDYRCD